METVIGCDVCDLPALDVTVTDDGEFRCDSCALAFALAAAVVTDEEVEAADAEVAFEERCERLMALAA